ncbi:cytidylyltransferase [Bacteriovorax sp. BAL6_X]|uniref:cytidylyltransferase n=1 Tax=Bacteriovorax sp. BAL6_X TaxID=1201290 RepID=UPI0003855EBA|nr:cytidylyltransferase [Bacteriovorax sp. BAL6_X]EPZ49489.1 cytidylyltransferase [Bacteriovorax sp. BAL6_X]
MSKLEEIASRVELYSSKSKSSVTLFGGSFHPFHDGHLECLNQCSEYEDNIIIVLDYSPWKSNEQEDPYGEYLKIKEATGERFPIYTGFWAQKLRRPTYEWLQEVKYPEVNWLMGDDTFGSFLKWFEVEKVCQFLTKIYVVPRDEKMDEYREVEKKIKNYNSKIEVIYLRPHDYQNLSSTKIRSNK